MSEHTPGPWAFHDAANFDDVPDGADFLIEAKSADGTGDWGGFWVSWHKTIDRVKFDEAISHVDPMADARLIAAAPDLLAACKGALSIFHLWLPVDDDELSQEYAEEVKALNQMRNAFIAAIAKATV